MGALALACQSKEGPSLPPPTGSGAPPAPVIPKVSTAESPMGTSSSTERASTGTLYPRHEAALGPKATGVISHIAVEEGDRVKKGQLLFRLDSAQAALAVEQAKAALASAQVSLDSAKLDFDRAKSLHEKASISPAAYDQARARLDAATTGVEQAKVAVGLSQKLAADTAVYSPISGVVTDKRMNVGETATMMPPSVVLVVQDVEALELRARLPETALRTVSEGSKIVARLSAIDVQREVTVRLIKPTIDARTRTIEIIADVDNSDGRLKAGMLAEISYGQEQPQSGAPSGDDAPAPAKPEPVTKTPASATVKAAVHEKNGAQVKAP